MNPLIEVDGDLATAESDFVVFMADESARPFPAYVGRFRDRLRRIESGHWVITDRASVTLAPRATSSSPGAGPEPCASTSSMGPTLFRHYFGQPPRPGEDRTEIGATYGVVATVLTMLEGGVTHLGVATDHVIPSFRNQLWPGYKTGDEVPEVLSSQFEFLEDALGALGVVVWPMVELEADDALASAATVAGEDPNVEQVVISTPDKDLAQCVVEDRVVQLDRRKDLLVDEDGVRAKFGVSPTSIPDWLALVGGCRRRVPGTERVGQALGGHGPGALRASRRHSRRHRAVGSRGAQGGPRGGTAGGHAARQRPGGAVSGPGHAPDRALAPGEGGRPRMARAHPGLRRDLPPPTRPGLPARAAALASR